MLRKFALLASTQPLSRPVPGESPLSHLAALGGGKAARRAAWRHCMLWLSGQRSFKLDRFPQGARRVLWFYFGESQLGDALMDLAPRSLLKDLGMEVHLFTTSALVPVFSQDPWLGRVGCHARDFRAGDYDCAVVLSNKRRPLVPKIRHFRRLPWVSLHEFFTGPNFHRGLFAAQRLADLAGARVEAAQLERHGRQKLRPLTAADAPAGADPKGAVALAVGGVHEARTYTPWEAVIRALAAAGHRRFALVGSENGAAQAARLSRALDGAVDIHDFTGRLTLAQTRAVLDACAAAVCPDSGLMHLALTTRVPLVPLFTAHIEPPWRLPPDCTYTALRSATDRVSDISPQEVAAMVMHSLSAKRQ